jgi:hypothetical protein
MSFLKLAWIPRSTPAADNNPYVHKRLTYTVNAHIGDVERVLKLSDVNALFDEHERDEELHVKYTGYNYISYQVETGDAATEILKWWSKRGYKVDRFKDDTFSGSRDYYMRKRDDDDVRFSIYMYFAGGEDACRFEDELDDSGQKIVDHVIDSVPAREAEVVYKRVLVCGDSQIPDSVEDEG